MFKEEIFVDVLRMHCIDMEKFEACGALFDLTAHTR